MDGGSVESILGVVGSGSSGTWKINGGRLAITGGNVLNWSGSTTPSSLTGRLYLNGGVLKALALAGTGGTSYHYLYLNGGTFEAAADRSPNIFDLGANVLSRIWVSINGAVIDTAEYAVTQTQPLLRDGTTSGGLTKKGAGTLTLAGTNTYVGATTVTGGTLKLGTAQALVPEMAVAVSNATYDLGGFIVTNGAVAVTDGGVANGTLAASSVVATGTCSVSASLAGTGSVTKGGDGVLSLASRHTFTGALAVNGGEVRVSDDSPAEGSALWLDAAYAPSLAVNDAGTGGTPAPGGVVGRWTSRTGNNFAWQSVTWQPTYETNVLNGLLVVRIPRSKLLTFANPIPAATSTVFAVYASISNDVTWASAFGNNLYMAAGAPGLNRTLSVSPPVWIHSTEPVSEWAVQTMELQAGGACRLWVNETGYGPQTMTGTSVTPFANIGNWKNFAFAEVLIYTNLLSETERLRTVRYLRQKWFGTAGNPDRLSTDVPVTVKADATLNLNGCAQTVASLSGAGTVAGAAVSVTGELAPGDDSATPATLTLGGDLTLATGLTNRFDCVGASADTVRVNGALTIAGANTVVLNLNGQKPPAQITLFTCDSITGDSYLTSWAVEGAGLAAYKTHVERSGNTIVLRVSPMGTVIIVL